MDCILALFSFLSLSFAWALSSSIGSEFETSLTCSKFHFEEKVLEKLVRLELTMQILEKKMDTWDSSITSKFDEMKNVKKQTETFVQSIHDAQLRDQMKFNESYQEIVQHFKTQAKNESDTYGDQMISLLESLSSKIQVFKKADQIVENFKVNSNRTLHELILKQEKDYAEVVKNRTPVAFSAYRISPQRLSGGQKVLFNHVWTNIGNGYEPSTGIFTAPRTGLYHITAVVMSQSGKPLYLRLIHNKVDTTGSFVNGDGRNTGTFDVVFNLQKADEIYIAKGGGYTVHGSGMKETTFSGHIIL